MSDTCFEYKTPNFMLSARHCRPVISCRKTKEELDPDPVEGASSSTAPTIK